MFQIFLKLDWNTPYVESSHKFENAVSQPMKYPYDEPKFNCDILSIPGVIFEVRVLIIWHGFTFAYVARCEFCCLSNISIFDEFLKFD